VEIFSATQQHQVAGALVALEDLVGDTGEGPVDVTGVEDDAGWCRVLLGH
jgi:hypothetical protein